MKIQFWAVGRSNEKIFDEAIGFYTKRVGFYFPVSWRLFPSSTHSQRETAMKAEAAEMIKAIEKGDRLVALDKEGIQMTSPALASFIERQSFSSTKSLIFIIGGAYGFDMDFLKKCDYSLSFSKFTFPHQLMRIILSEQIYRACSIMRHERYHH